MFRDNIDEFGLDKRWPDHDWGQHSDAYTYDNVVVSYEKIDAIHALIHPYRAERGLSRYSNPGGCDKFYCLHFVPELAEALHNRNLKLIKEI